MHNEIEQVLFLWFTKLIIMKNIQLSIPLRIKTTFKIWMSLFAFTVFLLTVSFSSARGQSCPSMYNVYESGSSISTTGSDVGVYYQILRNGSAWDVQKPGTGGSLYWDNLCSGDYTVVASKENCPYVVLNYGVPVSVVGSCFVSSEGTALEDSANN